MKRTRLVSIELLEFRRLLAVIPVLNNGDSGADTLRDAIAQASDGDTVSLAGRSGTITLASQLSIDKDITIEGPGTATLSISGGDAVRIFSIAAGANVVISNLALTNGGGVSDGGAVHNLGDLTLDHVVVSANTATRDGGGIYVSGGSLALSDSSILSNDVYATGTSDARGGGIFASNATLTVTRSTLFDNTVNGVDSASSDGTTAWGGGVALFGNCNASFTNCTIVNNRARGGDYTGGSFYSAGDAIGGGILNYSNGSIALLNCTISGNDVRGGQGGSFGGQGFGGGVYYYTNPTGTITNTIVAANTASTNVPDYDNAFVTSGGNNLVGIAVNGSQLEHGVNGDLVGTSMEPIDAMLADLADNGGPTLTMALLPGSPAIDSGKAHGAPATDQRAVARAGDVDRGAFELVANTAPTFSSTPISEAVTRVGYTYDVAAADDDGDDLVITASALPAWLSFSDNGDGTASLSGTPGPADFGQTEITLTVSDGEDSTEQLFTLTALSPRFQLNDDGVFVINGDDEDNDIHAWIREGALRVIRDGVIKNFALDGISAIDVYGFGGDDKVLLNTRHIPAYANGGDGNDTLTGSDELDVLSGAAGHDLLLGGGADDRLNGHGGNDTLVGGAGDDRLFGGDGNDLLYTRDNGIDQLTGGDGTNLAEIDETDTLLDVLDLLT